MKKILPVVFLLLISIGAPAAQRLPGYAIASATPQATQAGLEILAAGGNAFDAAVAVSAALAVTEPTSSGLGGGGFWLLHREADGVQVFVDGREKAPYAAGPDMFLGKDGQADPLLSRDGALAAGIPGEPAALVHIAQHYGSLPLAKLLAPAIRLARDGFIVDEKLAQAFAEHWSRLSLAAQQALQIDDRAPRAGERLQQADLAQTLERLADVGRAGFYEGTTAKQLLKAVSEVGGIWNEEDLHRYEAVERKPLVTHYHGLRIVSAPPPSAGGITLAETFNQLEVLGSKATRPKDTPHYLIESLRRAYRDRAAYLGDPDFINIPIFHLLSRGYARELAAGMDAKRATPSLKLPPAQPVSEGQHTTHFSIVDRDGNRVAATLSINLPFGSGFMAAGTGVLLNDEMDDFAASTTASNAYGLIGSATNLVAPGKRPLSSMSPTFVEGPRGLLVLGTPGGSRIITMVALGILGWEQGQEPAQIVAAPRMHHQYLPDEVQFEPGAFSTEQQADLQKRGYMLKPLSHAYGNMQAVSWSPATASLQAASDPRGVGMSAVVYGKRSETDTRSAP